MTSPRKSLGSDSARCTSPGFRGLLLAAWIAATGLAILPSLHGGPWAHDPTIAPDSSHAIALGLVVSVEDVECPVCLAASQARTGVARAAALAVAPPPATVLAPAERSLLATLQPVESADPARAPPIA